MERHRKRFERMRIYQVNEYESDLPKQMVVRVVLAEDGKTLLGKVRIINHFEIVGDGAGVCIVCKKPVDKNCWLPVCTNHKKEFAHYIANKQEAN